MMHSSGSETETYLGRFLRNLQPLKVKKTTTKTNENINNENALMHWLMIFEVNSFNSITQHWIF